ncbi:uncharacterized protein LOC129940675 [Eupeodes corollae]|uniref:uncharacterized protein LOC129940675 n=1 Tax=Eupeodes corollae TaxID=290404 RepID=UPI0024928D15|nr:uncharacterized protein LOC129940675 [Eupeodes corollae]
MSSHMGTNFLNSCIKVPIDPCNNCPAPIYNRPKVFLSRNSTTPSTFLTSNKTTDFDLDSDAIYASNGMRSLATFYDSIPDYCEINHLPENEFYSTLERLKMTYSHLKSKPSFPVCLLNENSTPLGSEITKRIKPKAAASSNSVTKKTPSKKGSAKREERNSSAYIPSKTSYKDFCEKMKIYDDKKSASPTKRSSSLYKSLSMHHLREDDQPQQILNYVKATTTESEEEKPIRPSSSTTLRIKEQLRKSFSFNDLNTKYWEERPSTELNNVLNRSPGTSRDYVPNINVQPPSPQNLSDNKNESTKGTHRRSATGKKKSGKRQSESVKVPFSFLGINECSIREKTPSVSPIHPVARPNLAATLRLQVSKKKVKELKNNCTFNDHRPQVDWEVRKTPAWKSLSHNESHKEILALRLATRKAEQEHQKRQYEMHMEIMRQRVKSAPLLLEGSTFWGPHVGKLSHSCHKDNLKHNCQHGANSQKQKKKFNKTNSRKYISNISYSRNSNHSTNLQESDELSSLDRAYL